jgi:hypothetical protein
MSIIDIVEAPIRLWLDWFFAVFDRIWGIKSKSTGSTWNSWWNRYNANSNYSSNPFSSNWNKKKKQKSNMYDYKADIVKSNKILSLWNIKADYKKSWNPFNIK